MGFWKSFHKGYEEEKKKSVERQENSTYRSFIQQANDRYEELSYKTDTELLQKIKNSHISKEDKKIIGAILRERGYRKTEDGIYDCL